MHITYLHQTGEASGRVHGISETASGDAPADHRVFRTSLPRQILRRRDYFGGAFGEAARGRHQLQLQIFGGVGPILCQCRFEFRF